MEVHAWVTSVTENEAVKKAIILAISLRRVFTSKKIAVLVAEDVSEREQLKEYFDHVQIVKNPSNDCIKVDVLNLKLFAKCVYLSPEAIVLRNCDELFDKYETFAICNDELGQLDSSVFFFANHVRYAKAFKEIAENSIGNFSEWLEILRNFSNISTMDNNYNLKIGLEGGRSLNVDASIAIFSGFHPLDIEENILTEYLKVACSVEKHAANLCLDINSEVFSNGIKMNIPEIRNEPVAVVGLSFRLPGANNPEEFWDLLKNGKEGIKPLPSFRWTKEHSRIKCQDRSIEAGFLDFPLDTFDGKFFGLSPKESEYLDPQQRLLHEVAWEALEEAMIDPHSLRGTNAGVFVGSWIHDYKDYVVNSSDVDFIRVYMGNSLASEAARLSHFFQTTGPSIATESGCSSGIVAVHLACKSLQKHETNLAFACGVNLLLHPFTYETLPSVLAKNGRCKTFDAEADGFGRAEACTVLLLKRLSDAVRVGNKIWGLIRGSAVTQEGISKSLGTPTVHCESLAMKLALKDAGVQPQDVDYIETHGTGTAVGDPLEVAAITQAYSVPDRIEPVVIGSVKTNVGHTESASGITGIIKVLLSMKNGEIPPHLNLQSINPSINLEAIPAEIPLTRRLWPRRDNRTRMAGVSSFGISGTDGHAIIQEPPCVSNMQIQYKMDRPKHILKISAKCPESLGKLLGKYERICSEKNENFANLAYSANTGRATFNHRAFIIANDLQEAAKILKEKSFEQREVQGNGSKLCFLFTGQGSQYPKMGLTLYETSPIFKAHFDKCGEFLKKYKIDIRKVLWGGASNELNKTLYSQTSIFAVEYCLLKLWESWGVTPDYVMGHSLGEFAAACAAGALDLEDALMLVAERSRMIDNLPEGKMLVIQADKATVEEHVAKFKQNNSNFWVDYAAINAPDQTVISGDSENIQAFAKYCKENSLKTIVLAATHAFHSRHMDPMLESYGKIASKVKKVKENGPKFISGMHGKTVPINLIDATYWVLHTREKVNFIDACKAAKEEGCSLFLEVGPHPVLSAFALMNIENQSVTCLPSLRRGKDEWGILLDSLGKLYLSDWKGEIDWKGFDRYYERTKTSLPFYPFNRKRVWLKVRNTPGVLHPLLGKPFPNASRQTVFESELTLKTTPFVEDHVIGTTVVFPGAGFLEMCLAGGFSAAQGLKDDFIMPRRPILLKGLQIQSPLAMHESKLCILQTIVHLDEVEGEGLTYSVEIYRQDEDSESWTPHASAKFLPAPSLPSHIPLNMDIASIQSNWESTGTSDFYEKLPEVGLRFGPRFQSLDISWKNDGAVLMRVKVPENTSGYLIHPVVADAMIQAVMIWSSKDKVKRKLQVPVRVGEFIWVGNSDSEERFVYCANTESGAGYAILLDGQGKLLAYMEGVEFAETSVKLMESMIQQQEIAMPDLWEEIYKNVPGPNQGKLNFKDCPHLDNFSEEMEVVEMVSDEENAFFKDLAHLTKMYFLKGLLQLGWKPKIREEFSTKDLLQELKIQKGHVGYCHFFLKQLAKLGYLEMRAEPRFNSKFCLRSLPDIEEISDFIKSTTTTSASLQEQFNLVGEIGRNMKEVLTGEIPPLQVLFPTDKKKPSAEKIYREISHSDAGLRNLFKTRVIPPTHQAIQKAKEAKVERPTVRILEIGAGTGSFTEKYYGVIRDELKDFEFWYTDITAAFEKHADIIFEDNPKSLIYKKFDMEKDPLEQGLVPEYFDLVLASEVIHIAKDVKKTLQNIRTLLKPGSMLQIIETIDHSPVITFVFGLLEGYWQFEDFDLRPDHTCLTLPKWKETFESVGFCKVGGSLIFQNTHGFIYGFANGDSQEELKSLRNIFQEHHAWIVFSDGGHLQNQIEKRLECLNRKVVIVAKPNVVTEELAEKLVSDAVKEATKDGLQLEGIIYAWGLSSDPNIRDQSLVGLPFLSLCKNIAKFQQTKIVLLTQGQFSIEGSELLNPVPATAVGIAKTVLNELSLKVFQMDLCPTSPPTYQIDEILANLWTSDHSMVAFRNGKRFCPKLAACKIPNDCLSIPNGCDRFQLLLPDSRLINDLEFGYLEPFELSGTEVEIKIKAMALNFRDVFAVLKPAKQFENLNELGLDFAGVISRVGSKVTKWKVGDRVIGMNMEKNLSLPSHTKADESLVIPLPKEMTFAEGVTLPAVFSTVIYCLIIIGKLKTGETLLLHTASGGVGLCAIQLAKHIGVNIIATAGSTRKRNYLRNLGIKHVFNSRTTDFGKQVLKVTNGKGVDIVLNSLTGEGFKEATLMALGKNGRFVEMSKFNIWTPAEVKAIRPDVFYEATDLTKLEKRQYEALSESLKDYLKQGFVKPIAYEMFDALNIRGALHYLQKAKHIGKIVCLMPEVKVDNSKFIAETMLFNNESTYVITGGLGGIGFEVVKFMLSKGAKHIAIVSRSKPRPEVESQMEAWNNKGKHVVAFSVDIGNYEQCRAFLEQLKSHSGFPTIRGIMHAAGVLSDALISNQTWNTFNTTFNPKVNGTWNLHDLTKHLVLEHFVLFSSIAAVFGSPGQANHTAGNSFEDALALYRRSNGLPATSINWGNWGEVGVATEVDVPGVRPLSTRQGLLALETILRTQRSHIVVLNVDSFALVAQIFPYMKQYIADKRLLGATKSIVLVNSDEFWQKVDAAEDREGKVEVFKTFIKITVKNILKLESSDEVDDHADFQDLGVDSLMMLEMKNALQNILGSRLTLTAEQLKDCTNTEMLANKFVNILEGGDTDGKITFPSVEELRELIHEDSKLSPSISIHEGVAPAKKVSDIQTVLLTGSTGTLGPYILKELSERPQITKIYCLIRKNNKIEPKDRLLKRLEVVGLSNQVELGKVECIAGDLTCDRFGLSKEKYEALAEKIDAVVHCAVRADHTEKYWKAPEKKCNVRSVNVKGTERLLEFAVAKAVKHFYYASTLLTVTTTNELGSLSEDWQDITAFDQLTINPGYPISKFISEQLVKQSVERGVPGKVFRFGMIGGDSRTGRCDYLNVHVLLRWLTFLKLRCMPDLPAPLHIFPVDYCAKFSLQVFLHPDAPHEPYNVMHKFGGMDQTLIAIAEEEFGIQIQPVSFSEFVAKLKEDADSPLAQFKALYEEEEKSVLGNFEGNPTLKCLQKYLEDSTNFFASSKLPRYVPNFNEYDSTETSMRRDVKFLKESGVFERFEI